ncbi:trehalose-phosphatase (plasmid) [Halostagnicola larsenii XH-48]|uniref:Trehalose 6-phosphate phosphatase n=1 Tax=Halostagnicola larsenii XH-48 TaxID=797299 RepID=W0JU72_9EURY|nr:trehalose-phosphatase [Halostagnicola larsenii]AHG02139.1 trehalose-phosphatase [Halostagnicola larsenii XH-48]
MLKDIPSPVDEQLPRIRSAVREANNILLCLDFDGTLAPIVDDPAKATPTDAVVDALEDLSSNPTIRTAVVSGRSLTDVRSRVDSPNLFAGNHGLEIQRNGSISVHPIAQKRATLVDTVCSQLAKTFEPVPHCWVENKRLTGSVHFRLASTHRLETIKNVAKSVIKRIGQGLLEHSYGKRVIEISPRIPWGKGNAVELLELSAPTDSLVVYLGDDTTDESAFEVVEPDGIGIRVGGPSTSWASARVRSPAAVASFLHWIGTAGPPHATETPAKLEETLSQRSA